MTRKEEINEQSFVNGFNDHDKEIFTIGAEWADEHPKEGFIDINKIYEWFYTYFYVHPHDCHVVQYDSDEPFEDIDDFVEQFKKAMEEQLC